MSQGIAMNINDWDDDSYHVEAHNDFRKSDAFSRLPPAVQQIVSIHVQAHQERLVQQRNLQLQASTQDQMTLGMNGGGQGPNPYGESIVTPDGGLGKTRLP